MSGGKYDYAFRHLEDFADSLRPDGSCYNAPPSLRRAFADHCRLVAKAMRACEWNDSGDGDQDERELILQATSHAAVCDELVADIETAASRTIDAMTALRTRKAKP